MTATTSAADPFAGIVGQAPVVDALRATARSPVHAYLLVGPAGSGVRPLARALAAELLAGVAADDERDRIVALALADRHPDVVVVGAEGSSVRKEEAEIVRDEAVTSPVEGRRKVIIGEGFEAMTPKAAGMLLKTIEEPAPSTVLVLLAEDVPDELVTIASRCLRIDVPALGREAVCDALVADGVDPDRAASAAEAASGDLDRARVLAQDDRLDLRRQAWQAVPGALDGTGATAHRLVEELLSMVDEAMAPLVERQAAELEAFEQDREAYGLRKSARKALDEAHKRQLRRFRTDELRFGLALLQRAYRDAMVSGDRLDPAATAIADIAELATATARHNPNERLQLQALFVRLPPGR